MHQKALEIEQIIWKGEYRAQGQKSINDTGGEERDLKIKKKKEEDNEEEEEQKKKKFYANYLTHSGRTTLG